ncbi:hypothetical protein Esti_004340 [Eimeria stiedai]
MKQEQHGALKCQCQGWMATFGTSDCPAVEEGDVLGCAVDQSDSPARVHFFLNGVLLPAQSLSDVRGEVWPAFFVGGGAAIEFLWFNRLSLLEVQ